VKRFEPSRFSGPPRLPAQGEHRIERLLSASIADHLQPRLLDNHLTELPAAHARGDQLVQCAWLSPRNHALLVEKRAGRAVGPIVAMRTMMSAPRSTVFPRLSVKSVAVKPGLTELMRIIGNAFAYWMVNMFNAAFEER
jgi:hypothetical protein